MTETAIYLEISLDGLEALEQNKINISSILADEQIEGIVEQGYGNYDSSANSRTKDIVSIIIASSAAVVSIGYAISRVISSINNKKQTLILDSMEEVRDKDGQVLFDKEGKPFYKIVKSVEIVDPAKVEQTSYLLELFKVFRLRISSKG